MIGRTEKTFYTQTPFTLATRIPVEVATGDQVSIPVTLKNNTEGPITGTLEIKAPTAFSALAKVNAKQTIEPGATEVVYLKYAVLHQPGNEAFEVSFSNQGFSDALSETIDIEVTANVAPTIASVGNRSVAVDNPLI